MNVWLNNKTITLNSGDSLQVLIGQSAVQEPFAVAVNGQFVPKPTYAGVTLQNDDRIDILSPIQGG